MMEAEVKRPVETTYFCGKQPLPRPKFNSTGGVSAPSACPDGSKITRSKERCLRTSEETFLQHYPLREWFQCGLWEVKSGRRTMVGVHAAITPDAYQQHKSKFVTMLRQPVRRVASSYWWFAPEFWENRGGSGSSQATLPMGARDYARQTIGSVTKQIAGQADGVECTSGYAECNASLVPDLALAKRRLRDGFAFIGLTDHWALSICLFHATIPGLPCYPSEFENSRPSPSNKNTTEQQRVLQEISNVVEREDPFDQELFAFGSTLFWAAVSRYNLDPRKCAALCPGARKDGFATVRFNA